MQMKVRNHINKSMSRQPLLLFVIMALMLSQSDISISSEPKPRLSEQESVFLAKCLEADLHIQTTHLEFGVWLETVTIAYTTAWENHVKVLAAAKETSNKPLSKVDLLSMSGEMLEFLPMPGASVISKIVTDISKEDSILVEAAKEITENDGALNVNNGISVYKIPHFIPPGKYDRTPKNPTITKAEMEKRLKGEMAIVKKQVQTWVELVNNRNSLGTPFDISFNPVTEIKNRMKIKGLTASELPKIDQDALAIYFEKTFWATWLSRYAYIAKPQNFVVKFLSGIGCIEQSLITQEIKQRCLALGVPMERYANIAASQAEMECNAISPRDKYTIKDNESQKWYRTDK